MPYLDTIICIRFAKKELEAIKKSGEGNKRYCFKNGQVNFSKYIRHLALEQVYKTDGVSQQELKNLVYQIRKIGVNINQVTAKINSGFMQGSAIIELQNNQEMIHEELKQFLKRMEKENGGYKINEHQAGEERGRPASL